jgi:hydrogenase nickel incorporation protein HypB
MCGTCGCGEGGVRVTEFGHGHGHVVALEEDILGANDALAAENRRVLAERGVLAVNLMSSPGSGKTTLLVRTLTDVGAELGCRSVEGDQETLLDAERIGATGARVVQVNTGAGCHLDATMLARAMAALAPSRGSVMVWRTSATWCARRCSTWARPRGWWSCRSPRARTSR